MQKSYACHSAQNVTQHLEGSHREYWGRFKEEQGGGKGGEGQGSDDDDDEDDSASRGGGSSASSSTSSKRPAPRPMGQMLLTGKLTGRELHRQHKHLVAFLVRDMRAFYLTECKGFRAFIQALNPRCVYTTSLRSLCEVTGTPPPGLMITG